jgi:quinol monooxygenase YgiN
MAMRITTPGSFICVLLATLGVHHTARAQSQSAPPDAAAFAVAYVEARASASAAARAALGEYRDALERQQGAAHIDVFEQSSRPGHFAIVEKWRDQAAFDSRDDGARKQLSDALEPIRVSGYDERPYKTLSTAPEAAASERGTVYVVAHVDVVPNPQAAVLLQRLAEASRKEAGNLRFDVVQHAMRANHFTVIEHWRSAAALDEHAAAAHTRQYRDELQPLTGSPLDERVYVSIE